MANEPVQHILHIINGLELPEGQVPTAESRVRFEAGCDTVDMYRGHPDPLYKAIQLFMHTNTRPYVMAGFALVMSAASYMSGSQHEREGMRMALDWLEQAKTLAPRAFEVWVLEPRLYGSMKQTKPMRAQLDALSKRPEAKTSFRYAQAELWYWDKMDKLPQVRTWYEVATKLAANDMQRLSVLNALASAYMMKKMERQAIPLYEEVVRLDPGDAWAWHNMSWMHMSLGDLTSAGRCNDRALSIMRFGNALDVRQRLFTQWKKTRHPDLLQDAPPYTLPNPKSRRTPVPSK